MTFIPWDRMDHQTIKTVQSGAANTASVEVLLPTVTHVSSRVRTAELLLKMLDLLFFTSSKVLIHHGF